MILPKCARSQTEVHPASRHLVESWSLKFPSYPAGRGLPACYCQQRAKFKPPRVKSTYHRHMCRTAVIWLQSFLSHCEGAGVSDPKNSSSCSKAKAKIVRLRTCACACRLQLGYMPISTDSWRAARARRPRRLCPAARCASTPCSGLIKILFIIYEALRPLTPWTKMRPIQAGANQKDAYTNASHSQVLLPEDSRRNDIAQIWELCLEILITFLNNTNLIGTLTCALACSCLAILLV